MQVIRKNKIGEFKIAPLRIDSKIVFNECKFSDSEHSLEESPCFKKQYSMASTIDSPLSISSGVDQKQINELPELSLDEVCQSYFQNGYCLHGTECTLVHCGKKSQQLEGSLLGKKRSTVLTNFPELLMLSPLRKTKSILY